MNLTERIIENIRDLPTLPTVYLALSKVIADPSSTAQDVSRIVACDQASAARVLRLANSVMYGFPGQIDTISRAVVVLGFDEIRNLVLSTVVMDLFSKQEKVFSFRPADFWAHSVAVGIATRLIGKACRMPREENCFVAGVLHDIGKLVFFEYAEKQYTQALDQAHKGHLSLYETEQDLLGLDHSRGGTILAENWNLPRDIQQAIRCHHTGLTGEDTDLLTAAVHMADILVRALELGFGGDDLIPRPQGEAWALLRLPPQALSGMVPDLLRNYQEAVEIMGLQ